ncbi:MAG: Flp pilus assembly complex ATPase component TadA [Peptococcaceae bacterium]|nr:Flp pilus assembly complex ATPase component TadA [Peptococcaceae bacterium]
MTADWAPKKQLGDYLIENNLITEAQLQEALKIQRQTGERLGKILINLGYVTEQDIMEVLEFQLGIPQVELSKYTIDPLVVKSVPEKLIRRYKAIPIKKQGRQLTVAMVDPLNVVAIDDLRLASGLEIIPVLGSEKEIDAAIQKYFALPELEKVAEELGGVETLRREAVTLDDSDEAQVDEGPVVRLAHSLITQAIQEQASDIHIEPEQEHVRVRYRIDGTLREIMKLPRKFQSPLTSRIKIMAEMNIAEKRLPQDGRIQIKYRERDIDLRVSSMPTVFGEKIVIRLLDKSRVPLSLGELGFSSRNLERFNKIIRQPYGMVLITGPTGSGKTTTLYAVLRELSNPEVNTVTIEDPVEYLLDGISQIQVNPVVGLTFARGLRSILRQDPDIIMVGEIRDRETAEIAVQAANTGHLVLSTLHTNDAAGALTRLTDMGVEPFLVASSVLGVVAQRLVRVICSRCRETVQLSPGTPEHYFMGLDPEKPITAFCGKGCRFCNYTGFKGRTAISEVLPLSARIRQLVNEKASSDRIRRQAIDEGMISMHRDGVQKVLEGITTVQELMRVSHADETN